MLKKISKEILRYFKQPLYINRHKDRNFLIIATGKSIYKNKEQIKKFIIKKNLITITLNKKPEFINSDYHAFTNLKRLKSNIKNINFNQNFLIGSNISRINILKYKIKKYERLYFENKINYEININNGIISSNCRSIGALLILLSYVMGSKKTYIAGLDGYDLLSLEDVSTQTALELNK